MELHLAMRKILLALAFCCVSSVSWAQCTGVFPANTLCGNLTASPQPPAAFSSGGTIVGPGTTTSGSIIIWGNNTGTVATDPTSINTAQSVTWTASQFFTGPVSLNNTSIISANIASTFTYQGLAITFPIAGTTAILSNNNTFTGTTSFTGPLVATGTVSFTTPLSIAFGGTGRTSFPVVPTYQIFTTGSSANYVVPTTNPSPSYIVVEMCGGGAGGGAQATNAGTAGTSTSFAGWTAGAGIGGANGGANAAGGAGGTGGGSGSGVVLHRQDGGKGGAAGNAGAGTGATAGMGGISYYGGYGAQLGATGVGFAAQANSCGGGGGGGNVTTFAVGAGGGAGEFVRFQISLTTANTAFIYTVGSSGAGGVAGTTSGGAGGNGRILVMEHYQ